jgi:hypothetical protein
MNASFNAAAKTKFNSNYRKEGKVFFESFAALITTPDYEGTPRIHACVDLRLYGTASTWFAAIWITLTSGGF